MRIICPGCYQTSDNANPDLEGSLLCCNSCGTEWLARGYVANPYGRAGFQGRLEKPPTAEGGLLIDHGREGFDDRNRRATASTLATQVKSGWTRGRVTAAVLAALAAVMMAKVPIVAALPEANKVASVPAGNDLLRFDRVRGEHDTVNGADHLVIAGAVINPTRSKLALPSVRVALRDEQGREIRNWRIDLAKPSINAGETIHFRSAVAVTPQTASEVKLTMVPRLERVAGLH
ncbi:MAG: FxLYD domain-containing protein [Alphaproteobacteria bacterium]